MNRDAYDAKEPLTGISVASSPREEQTKKTDIPATMYAKSAPRAPAEEITVEEFKKRPVP